MRASAFRDRWKLHIITVISSEILVPACGASNCTPSNPTFAAPANHSAGKNSFSAEYAPPGEHSVLRLFSSYIPAMSLRRSLRRRVAERQFIMRNPARASGFL